MESPRLEILELLELQDGWTLARTAFNNTLAVPFSFHRSDVEEMDELEFVKFLEKFSQTMIEQFGDARLLPYRGEKESEREIYN